MSPILNNVQLKNCGATLLGLEVRPIHIDAATKKHYPLVLRQLHKGVSTSIQKTVFEFVRKNTTHKPPSYQALGRRATVKAVWAVDEQLADLTKDFDFLLQVTPINMNELWREFSRIKFDKAPAFYYRPLLIDPGLLKKKLWNIPIKRLEDPTISQIFREKRRELDIQFSMLSSLDNRDFLYNSLQLYGALDKKLIYFARKILLTNVIEQNEKSRKKFVDADQFYRRVNEEIKFYRRQYKGFSAKAMVRNDINAGLLVSKNCLFIDQNIKIPTTRVEALLHHEVGTHLLTYYNGLSQPFRLLSIGLSGYEELQEGLAVISELLVGELSRYRLVVLAARVIACKWLVDGASFIETYRVLVNKYHLDEQTAFTITLRVYRGGGLTKDSVYLRGLLRLLEYLKKGNKLDGLFVGKISYEHIPIIKELQHRKILGPTPLKPRYLDDPQVRARLEKLKNGTAIKDIIIGRLI